MSEPSGWYQAGVGESLAELYERDLVPTIFGPWAEDLLDAAAMRPGARVLDVACGTGVVARAAARRVGATGAVVGLDLSPAMLAAAAALPSVAGAPIAWQAGNALALPFADRSFDHVWMMWFLEHVADPVAVLRETRRVLVPGGAVTAIEVDYSTCRAEPSTPSIEALIRAMVEGMAASGWSDAGTRLPRWLREAGFRDVDEGERPYWWQDDDLAVQARYAADVLDSALDALAQLPGIDAADLVAGLADLRRLPEQPEAGLG
jgi:ubiquinone/menaquinone biosynthesis C-methylase UbiE